MTSPGQPPFEAATPQLGPNPSLTFRQLIIRVIVFLPLAYVLWHFAGGVIASMFAPLVDIARKYFLAGKVGALELVGAQFVFPVRAESGQFGGRAAELLVEVNSRVYTYGAPVFVALMLAVRGRVHLLLLGLVLLLPFQAWGVFFELLKDLSMQSIQGIPSYPELEGLTRELIIVGYQFGVLVLPMLVPIALVAIFARRQIAATLLLQR
jgi:hypothetical protein